ncbi:glycosyltransferase [Jatrophihabitans telluris]|uniref:Glycosyltransferase n=1 Tax=Jatrophihabitans telluris TaxID=2038343 RepID=A0ABY4R1H8_9ACTN|nr:glycosyltransferase [Jatrophihabitans telluris]UQX89357.1 glycosyltransferase [Jatrophihabitans telluris]
MSEPGLDGGAPSVDRTQRLAIVVVNYGAHALLAANLAGMPFDRASTDVVVVDNFVSADERAAAQDLARTHGWLLVAQDGNPGFGAGVNAGIAAATARCAAFLILNPDARIEADVAAALHREVLDAPLTMVSPQVQTAAGAVEYNGSSFNLADGRIRSLLPRDAATPDRVRLDAAGGVVEPGWQGWLPGACLMLHEQLLERAGGFDESLFLYWEDVELSYRVEAAGGRLLLRRDLVAVHDEGGTQQRSGRAKSGLYYRYNCRNRLAFAAGALPRREVARWLVRTPAVSWEILLRGGRRQLVHSPRPLLAAVRGSLSGARLALRTVLTGYRPVPASTKRPAVLIAHPGAELYGSDRVMLETVSALTDSGCAVTVALPSAGPLVAEIEQRGGQVVQCRMPVVRKSALRPRGFLALLADAVIGLIPAVRLIRRHGRAAVYVSTITVPSWLILGRLLGRRVVCHVHEAERSAPRPVRMLLAAPALAASRLVVNSQFSLDVLVSAIPRLAGRSVVVYNGVIGPQQLVPAREDLLGGPRLLFIGRLSPRKGPQVALAALAELARRGHEAHLVLLGSVFRGYEWFETDLRTTVQTQGLSDRVRFAGFEQDVWPLIADSDIVLVPSVADEPFGNTAVEAVLAARPLLVSATSGLMEAAAGYTSARALDPAAPASWADAVEAMVADWSALRGAALADAAVAEERHSLKRYRDELNRVLLADDQTWQSGRQT